MDHSKVAFLAQLPLFSTVESAALEQIAHLVKHRVYRKGEVIYHQGDLPNGLYIVLRGAVKTFITSPTGKQFTVGLLRANGIFGQYTILAPAHSASAVALEPSDLLFLERDRFYQFLHDNTAAMDELLRLHTMSRRLLIQRLYDQTMLDLPTRIAKLLCRLVEEDAGTEAPLVLPEYLTQVELAALAGSTRESVNQCLRLFARSGWLHVNRGRILITDLGGLTERSRANSEWASFSDTPWL